MKRRKPYWIKRFDQRGRGSMLRAILQKCLQNRPGRLQSASAAPTVAKAAKRRKMTTHGHLAFVTARQCLSTAFSHDQDP
jgi:hypothetical protein